VTSASTLAEAGVSDRETEVLALLGEHLSHAEIAARLFISVRTVESHVAALRRKLNVGTHRELVRLAAGYPAAGTGLAAYAKTGTTNRALASLFAANHGLIPDPATRTEAGFTPGTAGTRSTGPASR